MFVFIIIISCYNKDVQCADKVYKYNINDDKFLKYAYDLLI